VVKKSLGLWLLLASLISCLKADALDQKVAALMDSRAYNVNQKFVQLLFKNREEFYDQGRIDFAKVALKLKENGLLKLSFGGPKDLHISFLTPSSPLLFTKAVSSSLQSLGYYYFAPKEAEYQDGLYRLGIEMSTEYAIDPTLLIEEFKKRGYQVADVAREGETKWRYTLELVSPLIPEAESLELNQESEIARLSGEYWLDVKNLAGTLSFASSTYGTNLYPQVTLFDASLRIISSYRFEEEERRFSVTIPSGVRFVRITDSYSPSNIKTGIRVKLAP